MILIYTLQPKTKEHNWLAKTLFGILLATVSKACGAQICQEKGVFSTVHLRLNWEGESLSSRTEKFP